MQNQKKHVMTCISHTDTVPHLNAKSQIVLQSQNFVSWFLNIFVVTGVLDLMIAGALAPFMSRRDVLAGLCGPFRIFIPYIPPIALVIQLVLVDLVLLLLVVILVVMAVRDRGSLLLAMFIGRAGLVVVIWVTIVCLTLILAVLIARTAFVVGIRIRAPGSSVGSIRVAVSPTTIYRRGARVWKSRSEGG